MSNFSFYFLIRSRNAFPYVIGSIRSVLAQNCSHFTILFVDDCSEYTRQQKKIIIEMLKGHIVIFNTEQKYSLRNAYELIHKYVSQKNAIVINLDGDDWLMRKDVIQIIETTYKKTHCLLTYGDCLLYQPGSKNHRKIASDVYSMMNRRYPHEIEIANTYRKQFFKPLHLRTWSAEEFKKIPIGYFQRPDKSWIRFCEDQAIFIPLLEAAHGQYSVIQQPLSMYNLQNPFSDQKINLKDRLFDEVTILKKPVFSP